jgi:hypothetical protein
MLSKHRIQASFLPELWKIPFKASRYTYELEYKYFEKIEAIYKGLICRVHITKPLRNGQFGDRIQAVRRFIASVLISLRARKASCTISTGLKAAEEWRRLLTPSSTKVKEKVEL